MSTGFETQDVSWNINYKIHLGGTWGRFMAGLQDGKLMATSCDRCAKVFVPPQSYCETCFEPASTWLEVPATGTLNSLTISYHEFLGSPAAPYALGAIQLDGADTMLIHFLGGADLTSPDSAAETLRIGDRFTAVWKEQRRGHILDIEHFVREAP